MRIGLACSGSTTHNDDAKRSLPLHLIKPLLELPFEFHLLQKEVRSNDEEFLAEHLQVKIHHKDLADFSDTAALIAEMDLVISVDTSVAHLAGALGKPVWILLAWKADWRWLLDRADSPWYRTATLFRQPEMGNWKAVVENVCRELSVKILQDQPAAYFYSGNEFYTLKRFGEALAHYDYAISLNPTLAEAYCNRGAVLNELERFDDALLSYDRAISLNPKYAEAYSNRGIALNKLKRFDDALLSYDCAISLNPKYAEAYCNRGAVLNELKRFDDALLSYDCAISLNPKYAEAYNNRGIVLNKLKRFDDALLNYDCAIALKTDYAESYYNRGVILDELMCFDEALLSYDHAISLNPKYAEAYSNRGVTLNKLKRFDEALINYDKAISLKPDLIEGYWNKAFLKLILGDYELGWQLHEWRWKSFLKKHVREFSEPLWLGDASISGKTLLIYAEQGIGDVIQFCRYVYAATALGAKVILEVYSPLVSLLSTLGDNILVVDMGASLPVFDFQCPVMSLPLAFKTSIKTVPVKIPYLFVDVDKQNIWKERLGIKTKKRIGLVCSGSTIYPEDAQRSISLHLFESLLELPFEFHLLQKEIRSNDETFLAENSHIQTHQENLFDFSCTAALVKEMDLVISVDTSVAHLAGALGCPVWVLLAWNADWRWLLDRSDSPWYPTATLFRQPEMGNWKAVIDDVCRRLSSDPSATKDTLIVENDAGLSC